MGLRMFRIGYFNKRSMGQDSGQVNLSRYFVNSNSFLFRNLNSEVSNDNSKCN